METRNDRPEGRPAGVGTHGQITPTPRHDGSTDLQAARYVPDFLDGRQRILGGGRTMTVGDVSKVLAAMVNDTAPQEPSAAWCPWCQASWQERVDQYPRVRIHGDLSWECTWCCEAADPILEADSWCGR